MRKLSAILVCIALALYLTGCMGTENYYQSQIAYYNAQAEASRAYIEAMNNRQPLAEMVAPDGTRFVVNQTGTVTTPVIRTTQNPIVEGLKTVVNSTPLAIVAGGWTAKQILKNATGDINASGGSTVTSTSNSHNATDLRNADGNISDVSDSYNQTAPPTVVTQPDPTIVPAPDPVIVPAPAPVIIPAPDPVIVDKDVVIVDQSILPGVE